MHRQENESNRKADRLRIGERRERQRCENPRHPQDAAGIAEGGIHQEGGQQALLSPERVLHRTIAVTNRHLCSRPFLQQMENVLFYKSFTDKCYFSIVIILYHYCSGVY